MSSCVVQSGTLAELERYANETPSYGLQQAAHVRALVSEVRGRDAILVRLVGIVRGLLAGDAQVASEARRMLVADPVPVAEQRALQDVVAAARDVVWHAPPAFTRVLRTALADLDRCRGLDRGGSGA